MGKPTITPFSMSIEFDSPSAVYISTGDRVMVVDSGRTRLLIEDAQKENSLVRNIVFLDNASLINKANTVTGDGNYFYVAGNKMQRNSTAIEYDRVVRYDRNGKNPTLVYESEHDENGIRPYILNMCRWLK